VLNRSQDQSKTSHRLCLPAAAAFAEWRRGSRWSTTGQVPALEWHMNQSPLQGSV
jgi:hypothetical protein